MSHRTAHILGSAWNNNIVNPQIWNYEHRNEYICRKGEGQHFKKLLNYRCPHLWMENQIFKLFYSQEVTKRKAEFVSENWSSSLSPKCGPWVASLNLSLG